MDVPQRPSTPDPWTGELALRRFEDRNPDPRIIEVDLEARIGEWEYAPGQRVRAMTYNGSVPGPLLEGHVGDTVIVHFTNSLPEPTTIHWHGVRVPADMDGTHFVHQPVPPGGTFEYRFELLDAGTFWYHPHINTAFQVEQGLYGPIVVRGEHEPAADREGVLLLDDLKLAQDGSIAPPGGVIDEIPGREGPVLLVNGRSGVTLPIRAGARQRWRVINAANARYFLLALEGHSFTLVGSDGGPIEQPRAISELLLVPGERADLLIDATGAPGTVAALRSLPYVRGHGGGSRTPLDVLRVQYDGEPALALLPPPGASSPIAPIGTDGTTPRTLTFSEQFDGTHARFLINGSAYPDVPPIRTRLGATEVWDLVNTSTADHPFHLHGFFFQVISRGGVPEREIAWHDTVNLPAHQTVRIAFRPELHPGMWMYHCHILEHAENGMMGDLEVMP